MFRFKNNTGHDYTTVKCFHCGEVVKLEDRNPMNNCACIRKWKEIWEEISPSCEHKKDGECWYEDKDQRHICCEEDCPVFRFEF